MSILKLENGVAVLEARIKVIVTKYDLVAVAAWAVVRGRKLTRKTLATMTKNMITNSGISGIVRTRKQYGRFLPVATRIVNGLYPELS